MGPCSRSLIPGHSTPWLTAPTLTTTVRLQSSNAETWISLLQPWLLPRPATWWENVSARSGVGLLGGLAQFDVLAPHPEDWERIADLVRTYADFPLGGTDASVIALAERLRTNLVVTLDERHFRAVQPLHWPTFQLLP